MTKDNSNISDTANNSVPAVAADKDKDQFKSYGVGENLEQDESKDSKDSNKKDSFGENLMSQMRDEMKENPEIENIVIAIKVDDIKKASQAGDTSKVKAEKITTFKDGTKITEEIEVEMSPEQAQDIINGIEKNKGQGKDSEKSSEKDSEKDSENKDIKNYVLDVVAAIRGNGGHSSDSADVDGNKHLHDKEEDNSLGR